MPPKETNMGTSNFLYRDSLYAMDTYVPAGECQCDQEALTAGCEHESDCPTLNGYHDEFIYDNARQNLIQYFKDAKAKHVSTVYEVTDEWTDDNQNFGGRIVGRAYYNVDRFAYTLGIEGIEPDFDLTIGDDYCLRSGYYSGFNFDRLTNRYADYGCDELEALSDDIHERLHKYDEADIYEWLADREIEVQGGSFDTLSDACQNYGLELPPELNLLTSTDELFAYIADLIHANIMDNVTKAVEEMDTIYHTLGKQGFEQWGVVDRASNGETWYVKIS